MAQALSTGRRNRLTEETSPYLRQHADNPVDWYPWGSEALERARHEHRPILLSIGYSACHWCHVMAHESFEDEDTARLMNERFVNIKVDREERPDLDRIYQIAHQMLAQRTGGWPLTMFLMPDDQRPFFSGTYFPKDARHGLPAFRQVLERVADYFAGHETELRAQNDALMNAFADLIPPPAEPGAELRDAPLIECRAELARSFDARFGGFGGAPKFPHATTIERLLRDWHASSAQGAPDAQTLAMLTLTLTRMGEGGLYDQVGGGFSRYSVDEYWMIPHFEKMLYDNGALLAAYAAAALATGDRLYARIAQQTAAWMIRDMQSPQGGFYSSLDADSEGHEGLFYVWERAQVQQALTGAEFSVLARRFGLDRGPNFEGKWHLHAFVPLEEIAREQSQALGRECDVAQIEGLLDAARAKLLAIRNARVWPGRDEKILTSWNALAIRGLAIAARSLVAAPAAQRAALADSATRALDFIRRELWRDGRLL
ncbi:MAG TPA: thioredoxin domain-containing protein, partial [Steroidobacteraceae bacterium]